MYDTMRQCHGMRFPRMEAVAASRLTCCAVKTDSEGKSRRMHPKSIFSIHVYVPLPCDPGKRYAALRVATWAQDSLARGLVARGIRMAVPNGLYL